MCFGRVTALSTGSAALPKRSISGNTTGPNYGRSQENGHDNFPSPSVQMGKA